MQEELKTFEALTKQNADPDVEYDRIVTSIDTLTNIVDSGSNEQVKSVIKEIDEKKARRATVEDEIQEIKERLESSEEERVTKLNREYETTVQKIGVKKETIKDTEEELKETKNEIADLQNELEQVSGTELEQERFRRELYDDLVELFKQGVGKYRDQLRDRVEQDASDIFLELTTEPDYGGLKINDNYGLTIVHEDGREIGVRSAGAEHVVALALMGALQNNAPLQGPIIMDSPFGRLDQGHVQNVVSTLPNLTDQVMLLVYEDEINPEAAREILKGKLRKEYTLERVSARHTELKEGI
jgi:DNA sulfur modification protein DndD